MRIKIISNPKKDWAAPLAAEVADFLSSDGHEVLDAGADATICIGGDGTILFAHHQQAIEGPVLGIGTRKSYICQLEDTNWRERLLATLSGPTMSVMALKAEADGKRFIALNDFVVHAKDYRVIDIEVSFDGERASFRGDGLIASTALGSAAYAYSAGGVRLPPGDRDIQLVPIAPYRRAFSPQVLPEDAKVEISAKGDAALITDGIFVVDLDGGRKVNIEKGDDVLFFEGVGKH